MAKEIFKRQNQYKDNIKPDVRVNQVANTENLRAVRLGLYDVDNAIKWHLENVVNLQIDSSQGLKQVPVIFATPEKWVSAQTQGFIRDNNDKIMTPIVVLNRTGVDQRQDYVKNEVLKNEGNQWLFEKKYSQKNKYTPFNVLTNTTPLREFYLLDIPRFINVTYNVIVWTEFIEQMNDLVEQIMFFNGTAFGDTQKYPTTISSPSFELSNDIGSDRFVKTTFEFTVKAYLINEDARNRPTVQKIIPANKVVINFFESSNLLDSMTSGTGKTSVISGNIIGSPTERSSQSGNALNEESLVYINSNKTKIAVYLTNDSAIINNATILEAPPALTPTTKNSFYYFINGQNIPSTYIISFTQVGNNIVIIFDIASLGYGLSATDEIFIIGKFL
jgi:hypothetical protein